MRGPSADDRRGLAALESDLPQDAAFRPFVDRLRRLHGRWDMSRLRIVEVARAAGVSRATAARVLSGATNVDPTMAATVEIAAKELGYEASGMPSSRSGCAGSVPSGTTSSTS
jgi:hypothetical protein